MKRTNGTLERARTHSAAALVTFGLLLASPAALAQQAEGGVARSGMEHGEALINIRSEVTLAIRGSRGTPQAHLDQLSQVVGDQMPAVRGCYGKLVAKRPATVGGLTLRISLDESKKNTKLELTENDGSDEQLTSCIRKLFKRADFKGVGRPAAAIIELSFANSRAPGQAKMEKRQEEADQVQVDERGDGGFEASYTTPDRRVTFVVSSPRSKEAVAAATGTLRDSFAAFLDCRRRAAKDGLSPAGVVEVAVRIQQGGKASGKVKSSSVAHERVIPCVERAFRRLKFTDSPAGRPVHVQVTYRE